ncbi:MAG TPA: secretion system protein E, partial [Rhodocyclaceae bacterium]|nr:secretion system protein E [Rhodocyclaceae bacterium]
AQRLVRRICPACKEETAPAEKIRRRLGAPFAAAARAFRGKGCAACNGSGYRGRVGIFEVLLMNDELRDRIGSGASVLEIARQARSRGLRMLADDGAAKVAAGETTLEEVLRVLGPQPIEE